MLYNDIISDICGQNWEESKEDEYFGALGIAIMLSYMNGIKPSVKELSKHLGVKDSLISIPFQKLLSCGVFSKKFNAKADIELLGKGLNKSNSALRELYFSGKASRVAWSHIAGIAAGFIFRNYN
jgi:hypothetical protein